MMHALRFDGTESWLVIGLGKSGRATADVLRMRGATVFATDEKPVDALKPEIAEIERAGARFVEPNALDGILAEIDAAVLSPGVPPNGGLARRISGADVPLIGEIEVAYRLCRAPILAVTGTKGKSTTTALLGHLLRACGRSVRVGGNIGNPLVAEVLDVGANDWVVAEVSSFQLETVRAFKPRVSVILNIDEDHLDRYASMDEYAEAKYRIFANQGLTDAFVGNLDDARLAALHWQLGRTRMEARQLWFTLNEHHEHATMYPADGTITYAPISGDPRPVPVIDRRDIPLAGDHNARNVMAALLAALAVGCDVAALREGVRSFTGMPHRLQPVAQIGGVRYVDDSKATNPGSVIAALRAFDAPYVIIAGGKSKGTDFAEMGAHIDAHARAAILIGEAADDIAAAIARVPVVRARSMADAVRAARQHAQPGDVVLLSPGCASFDMFTSAEDRGRQFVAAVTALEETAGA